MLTHLQERVAEIVRNLPEARDFALAGAGGLIARGLISRPTRDLDYLTVPSDQESVSVLRDALERALTGAGLDRDCSQESSAQAGDFGVSETGWGGLWIDPESARSRRGFGLGGFERHVEEVAGPVDRIGYLLRPLTGDFAV